MKLLIMQSSPASHHLK